MTKPGGYDLPFAGRYSYNVSKIPKLVRNALEDRDLSEDSKERLPSANLQTAHSPANHEPDCDVPYSQLAHTLVDYGQSLRPSRQT